MQHAEQTETAEHAHAVDRTAEVVVIGGGFAGLATLEDLVETLFGLEIVDEADRAEDMQALARQKWAERARSLGLDVGELTSDVTDDQKSDDRQQSEP